MNKITIHFILFIIVTGLSAEVYGQNQPRPLPDLQVTNPPDGWWLQIFLNNHIRIGGIEGGASTFAYSVGLPVIWAEDQGEDCAHGRLVLGYASPLVGRRGCWRKNSHYFKKQRQAVPGEMNFYTGISSLVSSDKEHQTGMVFGVEPFFNRYFK